MSARTSRRAFTLIELLVVVTIITLLLAMLAPMLRRAREIAQRVVCASNMRGIGQAAWTFATQHNGRGPGRASYQYPGQPEYGIGWNNILNQEFFKSNRIVLRWSEVSLKALVDGTAPKDKLCCPSMTRWRDQNLLSPTFEWSSPAMVGPSVDVASVHDLWGSTPLVSYQLGATLFAFSQPATKFLMVESESSNSEFTCCKQSAPYGVTLDAYGGVPPWAEVNDGAWAFRHLLPPDTKLYQTQATANFLFVDSHVEVLGPNADIQSVARTSFP